jgi:hypothetical protein
MSLAVGIGQVGIGLGSVIAGISFIEYGYLSNTVIGAASVIVMAVLVQKGLPEPELKSSPRGGDGAAASDSPETADVARAPSP